MTNKEKLQINKWAAELCQLGFDELSSQVDIFDQSKGDAMQVVIAMGEEYDIDIPSRGNGKWRAVTSTMYVSNLYATHTEALSVAIKYWAEYLKG